MQPCMVVCSVLAAKHYTAVANVSNVSATRNLGIKHLIIGGENEDWKVPEMQLPKVSTCLVDNEFGGFMHACPVHNLHVERAQCVRWYGAGSNGPDADEHAVRRRSVQAV